MHSGPAEKGPLLNKAPGSASLRLDFGPKTAIRISSDIPDDVRETWERLCPGWVMLSETGGEPPALTLALVPGGFRVRGPALDEHVPDLDTAILWLLAGALQVVCDARPGAFVLNAGGLINFDAAEGGRATLFAGASHAGKSSVALHLAPLCRKRSDLRLLGDDRLIVEPLNAPPSAASSGLARKVRVPIPDDFSAEAARFAAAERVGTLADAAVLRFDSEIECRAGVGAPIDRIVLLTRGPAARTRLAPAEATAAILPLIGYGGDEGDLVRRVATLVDQVPVVSLSAPDSKGLARDMLGMVEGDE